MPAAPAGRAVLSPRARTITPASTAPRGAASCSARARCSRACCSPLGAQPPLDPAPSTTPPTGRSPTACRTSSTRCWRRLLHARSARCSTRTCCSRTPPRRSPGTPARRAATTARGRWSTRSATGPRGSRRPDSGSQGHVPGWQDGQRGGGIQHLVVDTEIAWALILRVAGARGARARPGLGRPDRRPHHQHRRRARSGTGRRCGSTRSTGTRGCTPRPRPSAATGRTCRRSCCSRCAASSTARASRWPARPSPTSAPATASTTCPAPRSTTSTTSTAPSTRTSSAASWSPTSRRATRGCRRWTRRAPQVVRAWVERVLTGYWTHAGYLNWDTGLGFKRWHQGKKLGLSQAALLGIAVCAELAPHGALGQAHARPLLRALRPLGGARPRPAAGERVLVPRSTTTSPRRCSRPRACRPTPRRRRSTASGRCVARSRRRCTPTTPTSGRLAITTPAYNTAIVAVNRARVPVRRDGLARLFDGQQDVAGGVGGRPPASFGVVVRSGGKLVAASQRAVEQGDSDPLQLLEAPRGTGVAPNPYAERPYAGAFDTLRVRGTRREGGISIQTTHRFAAVLHRDRVAGQRRGRQADRGAVPELGRGRPRHRGQRPRRAPRGHARPVPDDVAWFHVESEFSGYVVVVDGGKSATVAAAAARSPARPSRDRP